MIKNCKKTVHLFMDRRPEAVLVFERNDAGLKELSSLSEQTGDSSVLLSASCVFVKYVLSCEQHFSYFDPD
jgi:hypothetical protein